MNSGALSTRSRRNARIASKTWSLNVSHVSERRHAVAAIAGSVLPYSLEQVALRRVARSAEPPPSETSVS